MNPRGYNTIIQVLERVCSCIKDDLHPSEVTTTISSGSTRDTQDQTKHALNLRKFLSRARNYQFVKYLDFANEETDFVDDEDESCTFEEGFDNDGDDDVQECSCARTCCDPMTQRPPSKLKEQVLKPISSFPDHLPTLIPSILNFHINSRQCNEKKAPRTMLPNATHHLILTWEAPAHFVRVAGTFTNPSWVTPLDLWWDEKANTHWIDLHEAIPGLSGIIQFKFIVDGIWRCDPRYPICDDGSEFHHLNNVSVVFPRRLRMRLSNQSMLRQQQHQKSCEDPNISIYNPPPHIISAIPSSIVKLKSSKLFSNSTGGNSSRDTHLYIPLSPTRVCEGTPRRDFGTELTRMPGWASFRPLSPSSKTPNRDLIRCRWRQAAESASPTTSTNRFATKKIPLVISAAGPGLSKEGRTAFLLANRRSTRPLKKKSNFEGLARCMSHHGARVKSGPNLKVPESPIIAWPSAVTSLLHSPEILLELKMPKVVKMEKTDLTLNPGWAMTPHPEKCDSGGADAFYISSDRCCLAVADGVGEWDKLGFSPRGFADELMLAIQSVWEDPDHPIHSIKHRLKPSMVAQELMRIASTQPTSYGSATCCIAVFDNIRQCLGICNLGDSGVTLARRNSQSQMITQFKTEEMTHFFNCPYQLSLTPHPGVLAKRFGLTHIENGIGFVLPSQDNPSHAQMYDVSVEEGDLILMATDGLLDNLWEKEILSICNLTLAPLEALLLHDLSLNTDAGDVARALTQAASFRSRDNKSRTPFAERYRAECGMPAFTGGKWDDITVVAAWVARKQHQSPTLAVEESDSNRSTIAQRTALNRWPYRPQSSTW